jgi:hypothetical protein
MIFLKISIHTQELGCGQRGKTQKDILGLWVDIRRGLLNFHVETYNARIEKASNKIDTQNEMTSFLVLNHRNQAFESMQPE